MNFNTKDLAGEETKKLSQYIEVGVQQLKINSMECITAKTGSKAVQFNVEGLGIKDPSFKGVDNAWGQVGRIKTIYMKTDDQKKNFVQTLAIIANKLGVKDELDAIQSADFEEYIKLVSGILKDKYAWFRVTGEKYLKANGREGVNLTLSKFGFVASLEEGEKSLKAVDLTNKYDLKPLETHTSESELNGHSVDAPF